MSPPSHMAWKQESMTPTQTSTRVSVAVAAVILLLIQLSCSKPGVEAAATDSFVYAGCSEHKYSAGTQYGSNVNSLLTSLLTSASYSSFTNLTVGTVHGLFQCRRDLPSPSDCSACVSACVAQLAAVCPGSVAAALRLDGCFIKYDNAAFLGVEDKTPVVNKCGAQQVDSAESARRDAVLGYLASGRGGGQLYRAGGDGDVQAAAECVGGLSPNQCQDCLREAIARLKTDCLYASWGDVYLASCYARYTFSASHASTPQNGSTNDGETQKTLAIIIGIIAVVGLIVISAAFLKKYCKYKCDK